MFELLGGLATSLLGGLFGSSKKETATQAETGTESTTGRTLNKPTEDALTTAVMGLLSGGLSQGTSALSSALQSGQDNPIQFNREEYVKGITDQATQKLDTDLESNLNSLFSGLGSGSGGNTMAALLERKARSQNAVDVAGVKQQAEGTGIQIEQSLQSDKVSQAATATDSFTKILTELLGGLKGASVSQDTTTNKNTDSKGTSSTIGFSGIKLPGTGTY